MKTSLIVILSFLALFAFSQTYYYERNTNDKKKDGHYITLGRNTCYDSDKDGNSKGNGLLDFINETNGIKKYRGNGYFGNSIYYFSSNYSKLEVKVVSTGAIFTYSRLSRPSCNEARRGYTESKSSSSSQASSSVVVPVPTSYVAPSQSTSTSTHRCSACEGTGRCRYCHGVGQVYDYNPYGVPGTSSFQKTLQRCPNCHGTGQCGACGGVGFFTY